MSYAIIQPPFPLQFRERSKKELETYRIWFHQVTPERIAELTKAVKRTACYESWAPSARPESLDLLGRWFETQVETRKKTAEEIEEIRAKLTFPIDIPEEDLTNKTFSLAMDIGMYFGQVILSRTRARCRSSASSRPRGNSGSARGCSHAAPRPPSPSRGRVAGDPPCSDRR